MDALEQLEEVVVYGTSGELIMGLHAESELNAQDISAYGANSVGDLLAKVSPDVDNTEQGPLILVNGKPANGIRSVNDLPPESIERIQVLPPQAAAALGESPTRRVINVVLKQRFRQGTGSVTARGTTAGRGLSGEGNASMVQLYGNDIRNIAAYARHYEPLLEAHRDIKTQTTAVPYDLLGNVVSWPIPGSEIDPDLSAAAGFPVTVAGVPAGDDPALADFVPFANIANTSDMGRYRTLVADQDGYGLNGNMSRQLKSLLGLKNVALNINANIDRTESESLTGASNTVLHVPASSPYTPFDSDVGIARYLGSPLQQESDSLGANLGINLQMQVMKWRLLSDTNLRWRRSVTDSERRVDTTALQAGIDAGTIDPFEDFGDDLTGTTLSDHARANGYNLGTRLTLSGVVFKLPAGNANANINLQWSLDEQKSRTTGTNNFSRDTSRQDRAANLNLQLPLLGSPQSQGFGMGGELSGASRYIAGTGTVYTYGLGLNARQGTKVNMRMGFNRQKNPPSSSALNDPLVTIDNYRTYDFLREETVFVRYITGGNPDLKVENRDIINLSGQVRPLQAVNFTLNAQYTRTIYHDPMNSLPPPSAAVQAAFPDRFKRDPDGRLYEVDARQVNFVSTRQENFSWGGNYRKSFGQPAARPGATGTVIINGITQAIPAGTVLNAATVAEILSDNGLSGPGWQLNMNFTHQWAMAYERLMRRGLPKVDLLDGGAGFGTPQSRHRVNGTLGLARNGTGMQLNGNWTGGSHLDTGTATAPSRLDFGDWLRFDLQAFANLATLFPATKSLKGTRLTLNVDNLLDSKQNVRDQNGDTPLRYQRYLVNPLGRVISLTFRKAFS